MVLCEHMSSTERDLLKALANTETFDDKLALEAARQAQRLRESDPAGRMHKPTASDPTGLVEQHARELDRLRKFTGVQSRIGPHKALAEAQISGYTSALEAAGQMGKPSVSDPIGQWARELEQILGGSHKALAESQVSDVKLTLDAAQRAEKLFVSDPAMHTLKYVAPFDHLQNLGVNPLIDTRRELDNLRETRWEEPKRDFHLEALTEIRQSIQSSSQQCAGSA